MSTTPAATASTAPTVSSDFSYSTATYFPTPFHLQQSQPLVAAAVPVSHMVQILPPIVPPVYPAPAALPVAVPPVYPALTTLPAVYSLPNYQQAHELFQRDAQKLTPEALMNVKAALASSEVEQKAETKKKAIPRKAAGQSWVDPTLAEWPENDYRIFCGDLGNEVNDDVLSKAFSRFPSFNMAKVVRDKRTGKTKGYGFVSFSNPSDLAAALKEMNGKYVGNRPIKLRKSNWKDRTDYEALQRQKNHSHKKPKPAKKSVLHK